MSDNNTPTVFTDEELKNLKVFCKTSNYLNAPFPMTQVRLEAILDRLGAAERCAGYLGSLPNLDKTAKYVLNEWNMTAGREKRAEVSTRAKIKELGQATVLAQKNKRVMPRYSL